jgi:hypothetical protein
MAMEIVTVLKTTQADYRLMDPPHVSLVKSTAK